MATPRTGKLIVAGWAGFFGWWGMRGAAGGSPIDPDASRHMMNGAMLYDMMRTGGVAHPVAFAQAWYARLPAISLPYHAPLFPLFESLFYAVFGVRYWVARLAVAVTAVLSVWLLARLVMATHGSYGLALGSILVLFSSARWQASASEVMLEFPAMALTLAALLPLRDMASGEDLTWRRGAAFAVAACAAVWTRQNALFLAAVPWVLVALNGSWAELRRGVIWVSSAAIAGSFGAIELVQYRYRIGFNQKWKYRGLEDRIFHNGAIYLRSLSDNWGWLTPAVALATLYYLYLRWRRDPGAAAANLYVAWLVAAVALHLAIPPVSGRYAFLWDPAVVVLALAMLGRVLRSDVVPVGAALVFFAFHIGQPAPYFYGLDEAARAVVAAGPGRVVCLGTNNGAFVAAVRAADPGLRTTVMRGDKLPASMLNEEFFRRFGVGRVVMVHGHAPAPWDGLWNDPVAGMRLLEEIAAQSSDASVGRSIRVYEFENPSKTPERILDVGSGFSEAGLRLVLP